MIQRQGNYYSDKIFSGEFENIFLDGDLKNIECDELQNIFLEALEAHAFLEKKKNNFLNCRAPKNHYGKGKKLS